MKVIELAAFLFKGNIRITSVMSNKVLGNLVLLSKCWVRNKLRNGREEESQHFLGTECVPGSILMFVNLPRYQLALLPARNCAKGLFTRCLIYTSQPS